MDNAADVMFNYLRDLLYAPQNATLDPGLLPEEFQELGQGLLYFGKMLEEQRKLASALAKGNLSAPLPSPENELAAPLKALHASLKHMTWQAEQVAKGDYKQKVSFMGEFADAFNTMTMQLDQRQKALVAEIESGRKKTMALEQSNSLFEVITAKISQWIVVVDKKTKERLFMNIVAEQGMKEDEVFSALLWNWLENRTDELRDAQQESVAEVSLPAKGQAKYLSINAYPMHWRRHNAIAFVITDISEEKEHVQQLENYAYQDNLTKVHNRYFGMQVLREWLDEHRAFCICFADMDNLKFVNDSFGHTAGDEYIIEVAQAMQTFAPDVVVSRLGGDEFMVLAPGWSKQKAENRMQEIRNGLLGAPPAGKHRYERSISYGVVAVAENTPNTPGELLAIADERMYQYKRAHKVQRYNGTAQE